MNLEIISSEEILFNGEVERVTLPTKILHKKKEAVI